MPEALSKGLCVFYINERTPSRVALISAHPQDTGDESKEVNSGRMEWMCYNNDSDPGRMGK